MKKNKKATPREKVVYERILLHEKYMNEMPTYQEIAGMTNRSKATIYENVQNLIDKGYLTSQGTIRGLEFTDKIPTGMKI